MNNKSQKRFKKVLISIYSHPEFYPPTINAAESLANEGYDVTILCNNNAEEASIYARGITVKTIGKYIPIRSEKERSLFQKISHWIIYTYQMFRLLRGVEIVLLYDPIPLFSFRLASAFLIKKPEVLWYHNHDIMEIALQRKYSISWWAIRNESLMFPKLDIFSLPSLERKKSFPITVLKGKYIFLPNFPSLRRYGSIKHTGYTDEWRIIYQGSIGTGHGLEEICNILPWTHKGRPIKLLLKGFVSQDFKDKINGILMDRGAVDSVEWLGITKYENLAPLSASCHIGIAIFTGQDVMNRTLGTASNKIYEYAASGVPILYFNDDYYKTSLGRFRWAIATDLTKEALKSNLVGLLDKNDELSYAARQDFLKEFFFEKHFSDVIYELNRLQVSKTSNAPIIDGRN